MLRTPPKHEKKMSHRIDLDTVEANFTPVEHVYAGSYGRTRKELKVRTSWDKVKHELVSTFVVVANDGKKVELPGNQFLTAVAVYNHLK
jgi:hypothetical protein